MEYSDWLSRVERTFLDQTGIELNEVYFGDLEGFYLSGYSVRQVLKMLFDANGFDYDPEWIESDVVTGREKALKLG